MKKVKLMLLSLSILAVVGGALAFTARGAYDFCTAPTVDENPTLACLNQACPTRASLKDGTSEDKFICTTTTSLVSSRPCKKADNITPLDCTITSAQITKE
jgi:hypothetical protein